MHYELCLHKMGRTDWRTNWVGGLFLVTNDRINIALFIFAGASLLSPKFLSVISLFAHTSTKQNNIRISCYSSKWENNDTPNNNLKFNLDRLIEKTDLGQCSQNKQKNGRSHPKVDQARQCFFNNAQQ